MRDRQRHRAVDAHALAGQFGFGHRPRIEGADLVRQRRRRLRPVELRLVLVQLVRVGRAVLRLRTRQRHDAGAQQAQAVVQHLRAEIGQAVVQLAAGVVFADDERLRQQHRAGVETFLHLHQAHAGVGVAGLDRTLDRRRAAPARQHRGVDVPAAVFRDIENALRQDQAVGDHDHQIRLQCAQRIARDLFLQCFRLQHFDAALQGFEFHRRRRQRPPAARRAIRLGVDGHDFVMPRGGAQAGNGKGRGAGEDDAE